MKMYDYYRWHLVCENLFTLHWYTISFAVDLIKIVIFILKNKKLVMKRIVIVENKGRV